MKEVLVSFKYNGSYGSVHGIYIMDLKDWKKIKHLQYLHEELYLGDVEGKYSDVYTTFDKFTLITDNDGEIQLFRSLFGETFGSYEPIDQAMELYESITYEEEEDELW